MIDIRKLPIIKRSIRLLLAFCISGFLGLSVFFLTQDILDISVLNRSDLTGIRGILWDWGLLGGMPPISISIKSLLLGGLVFAWSFPTAVRLLTNFESLTNEIAPDENLTQRSSVPNEPSKEPPSPASKPMDDSLSGPTLEKKPSKDEEYANILRTELPPLTEEATLGLKSLGINIREVLQHANTLATVVTSSKAEMETISSKGVQLMSLISKIDQILKTDSNIPSQLQSLFSQTKTAIEEVVAINTINLSSFHQTHQTIREMSQTITNTTTSLLEEAKRIQKIKEKANTEKEPA